MNASGTVKREGDGTWRVVVEWPQPTIIDRRGFESKADALEFLAGQRALLALDDEIELVDVEVDGVGHWIERAEPQG